MLIRLDGCCRDYTNRVKLDLFSKGTEECYCYCSSPSFFQEYLTILRFTSNSDKVNNKYYLKPASLEEIVWDNKGYNFKMDKAKYNICHEVWKILEIMHKLLIYV
ncbi:gamma-glutamylcyclotransferase 2-1-like [Solanum stenotomum]|uniref:gamma-glutamylcyclotransferase 2-1-like n=1 Tax=Solanum stenotomum TaxID=172797 RepID=UPI0020D05D6D|nr:gamma-glutamylcyclotransferase 2-1-like [Solanum stenotomum]